MSRIRRLSQVISEEGRRALASQQASRIRDTAFGIVDEANLNASTSRKVTKKAAFTVVLRSLQSTRNLPFSLREHMAIKELSQYITLAQSDKSHSLTLSNTDLLPVSHPRSTRNHSMTASALMEARARWTADDPRIVDGYAKTIIASALTSKYGSVEHIYYNSILSNLPQGVVPAEVIIAASNPFSGGNSSAERSLRARLQRRDRYGRFAFMGGGLSALVRKKNGKVYNLVGRPVVDGSNGDDIQMELPDGRIVNVPASKGMFIKAIINPTPDGFSKDTAKTATTSNIINEESLVFVDAPKGWKKIADNVWSDGDWQAEKAKDGKFRITRDASNGKQEFLPGDFTDWEDVFDGIADYKERRDKKKAVLPSGDKPVEQIIMDPPKDGGNGGPSGPSGPRTPKPFKFKYPDGAIKIRIDESYDPEGRIDEESPDFTDDPVELGQRFDPRDLVQALEQGVLPENEGDNAVGYGVLRFNGGDEYVPVQAIYNALDEAGEDAPLELARIYDKALGGNDNEKALKDNRKGVARLDQSKPDVAESFERTAVMSPDEVPATEAPKFSEAEMDLPPVLQGLSDAEMKQFMETGDHTPYLPENESIDMPEGYNSLDPAPFSSWREVTADTPDAVLPEGFSDNPVFLAQSIDTPSLETELRRSIEPDSATPGYANISLQDEDGEEFVANVPGEAVRDALQLQGVDTNKLIINIAAEGFGGQEEQIIMDPPMKFGSDKDDKRKEEIIMDPPKGGGPSDPEARAFAMADTDAQAIVAIKSADVSTISIPDEGISFDPKRAEAGLAAIKTGDPEKMRLATDSIWELVQSQREALLKEKYPEADLTDVKTFNQLYGQEFYGLGEGDVIKVFKGGYGDSVNASWRTAEGQTDTYFSTNPYVAAEYARFKDLVPDGKELPMFSMDLPIEELPTRFGQGAEGMQGSLEFPQVITPSMLAAQTPQRYNLPNQVYGTMSGGRYWPYDDGKFGGKPSGDKRKEEIIMDPPMKFGKEADPQAELPLDLPVEPKPMNAYERLMAEKKALADAITERIAKLNKDAEDGVDDLGRPVPEGWGAEYQRKRAWGGVDSPDNFYNAYGNNTFEATVDEDGKINVKDRNGLIPDKSYDNWEDLQADLETQKAAYSAAARQRVREIAKEYGYSDEQIASFDSMSQQELADFFANPDNQTETHNRALDDWNTSWAVDLPSPGQKARWAQIGKNEKILAQAGDAPSGDSTEQIIMDPPKDAPAPTPPPPPGAPEIDKPTLDKLNAKIKKDSVYEANGLQFFVADRGFGDKDDVITVMPAAWEPDDVQATPVARINPDGGIDWENDAQFDKYNGAMGEALKGLGLDSLGLDSLNAPKQISDDELLDRRLAGESLDAVAKDLGITREEVRRREANAFRKREAENQELPPTPEGLDAPDNKELIARFNRQYVKEFLDQEEALADKYQAEEDMPRGDAQAAAEADMKRMYGKTAMEALNELPREEGLKILNEREQQLFNPVVGKEKSISEPSAQAEAVAAIDVNSPNLQEEIQSAIDKGQKIAFSYNGKNRIVLPQSIWTNPKNGNVNLRAIEDGPDGGIKVFTLDKMEMAEGVVPTPPPVTKPKELSEADKAVIKNNEYVAEIAGTLLPTEAKNLQVGDFMWNAFFGRYEEILAMEPAPMGRIKFKVFNVYNNKEEDRYFEMDSPLRNVRRPGIEDEAETIPPAKAAPRGGKRGLIKRAPLSERIRAKEGRPVARQKEEEGLFKDKNGVAIEPGDVVIHPKHPEWGRGVVKLRIGAQVREGKKAGGQVRAGKVQANKLVVQFEGGNEDWVFQNAGRELKAGNLELFDGNYDDLVLDPRFRGGAMVPNPPANPVPAAKPRRFPPTTGERQAIERPVAPAKPAGFPEQVLNEKFKDLNGGEFEINLIKIGDIFEGAIIDKQTGDIQIIVRDKDRKEAEDQLIRARKYIKSAAAGAEQMDVFPNLDKVDQPQAPAPEQGRLVDTPEVKPAAPAGPGMPKPIYKAEVEDQKGNKFKISVIKIDDMYEAAVFNENGDLNAVIAKNTSLGEVQGVIGNFIEEVADSNDGEKVLRAYGGFPDPVEQLVLDGDTPDVPPLPAVKEIDLKEAKARAKELALAIQDKDLPGDARKDLSENEQARMKSYIQQYLSPSGVDRRQNGKVNDELRVAYRYAVRLGWFEEAQQIAAIQKRVDKLPLREGSPEFADKVADLRAMHAELFGMELELAKRLDYNGRKKVESLMNALNDMLVNPDVYNPNFRSAVIKARSDIDAILASIDRPNPVPTDAAVIDKMKELKKRFDAIGDLPKLPSREKGNDDAQNHLADVAREFEGLSIDDLRNGVGDWKFDRELSAGINKVYLLRNALTGERIVIKYDNDGNRGNFQGNGIKAEEMVAVLYRDLGFAQPAFVAVNPDNPNMEVGGVGVMQYADAGFFNLVNINVHNAAGIYDLDDVAPEHREELVYFMIANAVIGNSDRHGGNFMWGIDPATGKARLIPIDNGLAIFNAGFGKPQDSPNDPVYVNPYKVVAGDYGNRNQVGRLAKKQLMAGFTRDQIARDEHIDAAIPKVIEFATRMRERAEALKFVDPRANEYLMARADFILKNPRKFVDTLLKFW